MDYEKIKPVRIDRDKLLDSDRANRKRLEDSGYNLDCAYVMPSSYRGRFDALVHVLKSLLDGSDMGKRLEIRDEKLVIELKQITNSLVYLCNSMSMESGKYFDYDKLEIDRKLGRKK